MDDPDGHREATADIAVTNWFKLYDQIASLDQLNRRDKRARFSNQLKRARERIVSVAPLLAAIGNYPYCKSEWPLTINIRSLRRTNS